MKAVPVSGAVLLCGAALLCGTALRATPAAAGELRDPTRPPLALAGARHESVPVLSAVITSGPVRGAIVNGEFVRAGASVDGYTIEEVLADGVRYSHAGHTGELHLPQTLTLIKKPATGPARL